MARTKYKDVDPPLMTIAGKLDLYHSGTQYNFYENLYILCNTPTDGGNIGVPRIDDCSVAHGE